MNSDRAGDERAATARDVARALAREHGSGARLRVVATPVRPPGWVGKMWALETGVRAAGAEAAPEYWLLTDADVEHAPDNLRRLVAKAESERLDLVSLMVLLHAGSGWGALLVPAFVYFFQKLYPFPRVNDPRSRTAAAAGGCVLVRSGALGRAGGIEALRSEVIDDCALGRNVSAAGRCVGPGAQTRSIRALQESATSGTWWRAAPNAVFFAVRWPGTRRGSRAVSGAAARVLAWPRTRTAAAILAAGAWALRPSA